MNVVPAASVVDSLCKVRSLYTFTCAYSFFRNSSYYFQGKEKYSNGQGGREDLLGLSALMYFLQFVANASQQTIYKKSLCAVWTTVFERLGQKYVVTICGVVVILTAWKMCGEACKHSCCTNMSGIAHVHLLSCNGCLEGSAEVFLVCTVV